MQLVKLRTLGGNLCMTIPRALARELELVARDVVCVRRTAARALLVEPLEGSFNDTRRRSSRPDRLRR